MKKTVYIFVILLLTSCALDKQHTVGENFATYKFSGNDPIFYYRGMYEGNKLYQLNPSFQMSTQKEFGVLVDENNKVVKSLSREDMNRLQGSKTQNIKNIEAMNDSEIISYINSANDSELRLTSEYLSSEMQKMKAKNKYYADTERGRNLFRIQNAVDQRIRSNEIQIANEREIERRKQSKKEERPLTPAEQKMFLEVMNAYTKALTEASGGGNNTNKKNSGGWCVRVQPKENCEVSNIRTVGSPGMFQFSTRCIGRYGSSGSSGIGEVNCNNQTQWNSTNYSAQCYKC
jgi:hypothetical protein